MSARSIRTILACATALGVALGCGESVQPPTPKEAADSQRVLKDWFECEECDDGELAAVVELGDGAVHLLGAVVVRGLSSAARARFVGQLEERYEQRLAYAEQYPSFAPVMKRDVFLSHHLGNRDALYRVRALRALERMGTDAARDALEEAQGQTGHPGVEREIRRVLSEM